MDLLINKLEYNIAIYQSMLFKKTTYEYNMRIFENHYVKLSTIEK
jgi:hypothetical protein